MNETYLRTAFRNWMSSQKKTSGEPYKKTTIDAYTTALKNNAAKLNLKDDILTDLFNYSKCSEFEKVHKQILAAPNFEEIDISIGHKTFSNSMIQYSRFLKELSENPNLEYKTANEYTKRSNASFLQWFKPLIIALKELGGSATPEEARNQIAKDMNLSQEILSETRGETKQRKFDNEVAWARNYLVYENIIDKSVRGVWTLTEKGLSVNMTDELASYIFLKSRSNLKNSQEILSQGLYEGFNKKRYWLYSPGENSRWWDEFYENGIIGIGWDELGDLSDYATKEAIKEKMKEIYGEEASYKNSGYAAWQFANEMQQDDIIYVKQGLHKIVGRGVITSEYYFDTDRDEYKNIREVEWTDKGTWDIENQPVTKTLANITPYTDYCSKLEEMFEKVLNDEPETASLEEYTSADFLSDVFMSEERYNILKGLLLKKKNIILQGAPGVGKTYAAERLAYSIMGEKDRSRVKVIQFHQSYSYEDFIMGYRPDGNGFSLEKGPFYSFCKEAEPDDREYFFIIDEINRGNLSKIFGELLMLIEKDKRGECHSLRLLYQNEQFFVPDNVYIIGMMNTADRSLAMIDYALRRRFAFFEFEPAFLSDGFKKYQSLIENVKFNSLIDTVVSMNNYIAEDVSLGSGFRIGHSYFCTNEKIDNEWLTDVVEYELIPLIKEYWFDEPSKVDKWAQRLRGAVK